ncbi:solute carrier family 23 member 2-like [Macrobrachium rosenbergii]|uniref:solute carrier family 23 member 2-like n=1 Tax=Macrobrachium rosenbergii TaxID=79674 RepID=UPI0034D3C2CD
MSIASDDNDSSPPPLLQSQEISDHDAPSLHSNESEDIHYKVEDVPPWYFSIFFGFQHYLTMAGGTIVIPIIISSFLCMAEDDPARGALVSTVFFHLGLVTLLQTNFGVRLPIVQGGCFTILVPTIVLLTTIYEPCSALPLANMTEAEREEAWQVRIRDVQGSIAVASLLQIVVGVSGMISVLQSWISPLTVVPTSSLVGLSLFDLTAQQAAKHWGISSLTVALIVLFSQYLRNVKFPLPVYRRKTGFTVSSYRVFMCFPMMLAVFISWAVCWILTTSDLLPEGSAARTDAKSSLLSNSPVFRVPYPGQWGFPTASAAGIIGILSGIIASITENFGNYYACARVAGVSNPPANAINRGIGIEGMGCLLAGFFGTGTGTASCSQNVGVIEFTKVGSRRVVQYSAVFLILTGLFGKIGAWIATMPDPVLAGILIVTFATIAASGMAPLRCIDLNSSRNLFVLGFSIFLGLAVPKWLENNPGAIDSGSPMVDQILTIILQIPMFVGGLLGFFLDTTVPGTAKERGLMKWKEHLQGTPEIRLKDAYHQSQCYDLPVGMTAIKRWRFLRYLPFSPTFTGFRRRDKVPDEEGGI